MTPPRRLFVLLSAFLLVPAALWAEEGRRRDIGDYSLEDLLAVEVKVASDRPTNLRETPGIISVISREEILNSGARDLIDVLRLVPGFDFGVDTWSILGVGFRGNWGHEGKILLLLDGLEFNDRMYTTLEFGNHFSADLIHHIEIIRGPGSVIHGGHAELAVINVVTLVGNEEEVRFGSFTSGFTANASTRQNANVAFGQKLTPDLYIGSSVFKGFGILSDRTYTDLSGGSFDLKDSLDADPTNAQLALRYKELRFRLMYDDYHTTFRDGLAGVLPGGPVPMDFSRIFVDTSYRANLSNRLSLTSRLTYEHSVPWHSVDPTVAGTVDRYDATADRIVGLVKARYEFSDSFSLLGGTQLDYDRAGYDAASADTFSNGSKTVDYLTLALFSEGTLTTSIANLAAGVRYEYHSEVGPSLVPRVALTRVFGDFHAKLLYSHAFRAPGIEQIHFGTDVQPEKVRTYEAEMGYRFTDRSFVTLNLFDVHTEDPIVYIVDPVTGQDGYLNYKEVRTGGGELEYRLTGPWGYSTFGYSFYVATVNEVDVYQVPGKDHILLGFPNHKFTFNTHLNLWRGLSVNPSLIVRTARYGYASLDSGGAPLIKRFAPDFLLNLNLVYRNAWIQGLDLSAGVHNILNEPSPFLQPYDGGHGPLPALSREYALRVAYTWN